MSNIITYHIYNEFKKEHKNFSGNKCIFTCLCKKLKNIFNI